MSAFTTPGSPGPRRPRRYIVAGLATAGLVGGGAVVAHAATTGAASPASSGPSATSSAPSRPAPPTPTPHLDGTVVGVSGDTITLTDHDGFTRVIDVGSSTTYTLDGKSSTLSAATKGRFVHGAGTVDSNGTSLDASTVTISTSAPKPGGPGGPGGRGPDGRGPGGRGPGGPAGPPKPGTKVPAGAPAAPKPSSTAHGS